MCPFVPKISEKLKPLAPKLQIDDPYSNVELNERMAESKLFQTYDRKRRRVLDKLGGDKNRNQSIDAEEDQ